MKHYAVAQLDVTDPAWVRAYVAEVTPMVERHGGRYLARTTNLEQLEGEGAPPQLSLLIEWPSREAALAFYESDEYRPHREACRAPARATSSCSSPARTSTASRASADARAEAARRSAEFKSPRFRPMFGSVRIEHREDAVGNVLGRSRRALIAAALVALGSAASAGCGAATQAAHHHDHGAARRESAAGEGRLMETEGRPAAERPAPALRQRRRAESRPDGGERADRRLRLGGRRAAVQRPVRRPDAARQTGRHDRGDDPQRHQGADEHPLPRPARLADRPLRQRLPHLRAGQNGPLGREAAGRPRHRHLLVPRPLPRPLRGPAGRRPVGPDRRRRAGAMLPQELQGVPQRQLAIRNLELVRPDTVATLGRDVSPRQAEPEARQRPAGDRGCR